MGRAEDGEWAVVDLSVPGDAGVLLIAETRGDAEEIAFEVRRRGQRVAAVNLPPGSRDGVHR